MYSRVFGERCVYVLSECIEVTDMYDLLFDKSSQFGSLAINIAAIVMLAIVFIHTGAYRKRAQLADKVFFAVLCLNIAAVVLNIIYGILMHGLNVVPVILQIILTLIYMVYSFTLQLIVYLMAMFLTVISGYEDKVRKYWLAMALPMMFPVFLLSNLFNEWLYDVADPFAEMMSYRFHLLLLVPMLIYIFLCFPNFWKIGKPMILLMIILIATNFFISYYLPDIRISAFIMTLFVVFSHICMMNTSFYEEVRS